MTRFLPFLICLCFVFSGCSTLFSGKTRQIKLMQDSYVTSESGKIKSLKKGQKLAVSPNNSLLIESPGYVGLLVLSDSSDAAVNQVSLKRADAWLGATIQKKINQSLNEIVVNMNEAQVLLSSRRGAEALSRVQILEKKYPDIISLQVLEASCHVILGEKNKALSVLTEALRLDPTNESAQSFYRSLRDEDTASRQPSSLNKTKGKK